MSLREFNLVVGNKNHFPGHVFGSSGLIVDIQQLLFLRNQNELPEL